MAQQSIIVKFILSVVRCVLTNGLAKLSDISVSLTL